MVAEVLYCGGDGLEMWRFLGAEVWGFGFWVSGSGGNG